MLLEELQLTILKIQQEIIIVIFLQEVQLLMRQVLQVKVLEQLEDSIQLVSI
jgi:hypothetical protein